MNTYQAPKTPQMTVQRFPVMELREGMEIALSSTSHKTATLPSTVGQVAGGSYHPVRSVMHIGDGKLKVAVLHPRAPHPSGLQIFIVPADQKVIALRPATVVGEARPVGASQ